MKILCRTLVSLVVAFSVESAWAAPGAGSKASGQFNFYGSSSVPTGGGMAAVSPIVAKEAVDSIDHAVAKSEKYLATVRRPAVAAGYKETVATVDQIGTHLAEVKKCCRDLAECCEMDMIDDKRSAACCKELEAALGKAIAAHDKLVPPPTVGHGAMPAGPHHA